MITFVVFKINVARLYYKTLVKANGNILKEYTDLASARNCYEEVSNHLPCAVIYNDEYNEDTVHLSFPSSKRLKEIDEYRTKHNKKND